VTFHIQAAQASVCAAHFVKGEGTMNNNSKPRFTSKDLSTRITKHIQELAQATDAARISEEMLHYLDMCAKFHKYSPQNVWLIMMSRHDATWVAGFHKWRSMGRYVKKGEQGIPILAPIFAKIINDDGEEEETLVGFKVVYVFDLSQTDGKTLPEPPDWKSSEQNAILTERLIQFANKKGITVKIKELTGNIQGVSRGGAILLAPEAGTKTLIHKIAHELLHKGENIERNKTILELEAESVAYVVGQHFGLKDLASPNYVALHSADAQMIMVHLERIRNTATQIIKTIDTEDDSKY
jgi:hypothetical protein